MPRKEPFPWILFRILVASAVFASSCVLPWLATQAPPTPPPSLQDDLPGAESVPPTALPEYLGELDPEIEYPEYEEEPYIPPPPSILDAAPELPEKAQGEPVDLHLFATPGQIAYDGYVTFSAIVTNDSADTLNDLLFIDELETGFTFLPDVNQTISFDASNNTISYEIDELAPGGQVAFNYTLQVTAPKSSPKGELWVHTAETNSKDGAVALKASAELWVGQPALQSNIEVARLDKDGGWAETENASIYIEPNALQQDAIAVISPVAVDSGPDLQFQVELYETENAADGEYDGLAEQQLAVTDDVSDDLAIPAFMEVDFDSLGDLDALPGGKEPFVTTYIPELDVWVKMPPTLVDYDNNTVTVETDHFSTWGAGIGDSLPQNGANVLLFDQPYTSLFTGAARYSVPIWTPPGRAGMQPGVSLSYSSATVDGVLGDVQAPWVGVGWNMDAIEIVRKIETDEDGYGYVDEYALTFNGALHDLIQDENDPERYHTKRASFLYVERHNEALGNSDGVQNDSKEWWEVVATDGTRYRIGWNTDAEQLTLMYGYKCITGNPCDTPEAPYDSLGYAGAAENLVAMRWRVDRVVDSNGNFIEYNYTEHGPDPASQVPQFDLASYLSSIEYTGHLDSQGVEDLAPGYKMEFNTEDRVGDDNPTDFGIWDHWDTKQLDSIEIYCTACSGLSTTAVRTYDFEYSAPSAPNANGTLVLDSITISGGGFTESSQSIPSTTAATVSFTYANKDNRAVTGEDNAWAYPRLTVIDNGYGASLNYSYENDGRSTNSWYNWRASEVRVKSDFDGSVSDAAIQKYAYSGVQYTNEGGAGLGSLIGYADVTETSYETDGTTKILDTTHKFGTLGLDTGRELWTELRDPSNSNVLRKSSNTYFTDNSEAPFVGWEYRYLSETKSYTRIGSSLSLTSKTFFQRDPGNGNLLVQMDYLGGALTRKHVYEYNLNTNPDVYILDRVSRMRIKDASDNTLSEMQYQYDNTATAPSKGNLTLTQSATGDGTKTVDSSYAYDAYGNVTSVSSYESYGSFGSTPSGSAQTTSTTYESTYRTYPTTVTNDLSQSADSLYLYTLGMPYEIEDLNDWTTSTTYDGLGRVLTATAPGFGSATVKYTYPTVSSGEVSAPYAVKMEIWDTMPATDLYRPVWGFYDGLGRIVQNQVQGGSDYLVTYTDFNEQGLVGKQSVSVEQTGTGGTYLTPAWANLDYSSTTYDLLGRATEVTAPGNITSSTSYDGLTTTVTNPNGEKISREMDGLGRLIKVQEWQNQGANVYATTLYYYDIFNRLTRVRDAELNGTDIAYDWLGRKTSMDDPDMGAWTYEYDPQGNLTKQTDARNQVLLFAYDDLNRLTNKYKDSISVPNEIANYSYGTIVGTNLGLRTAMSDQSGSTAWAYSNYARSVTETRTIDTNNYAFTTATDWLGRPITITYPDSEVVTYTYDDFGRADSVSGSTVGDLADLAYTVMGQLDSITLDNGIVIDNTYHADNFRLTDRVAQKSGSAAVIDFDYGYDSNGNITTLDDNVLGHDFTFEYDHLNRLTSADEDSADGYAYRQTYEYDQVGNILNVDEWLEDIIFSDDFEGTDLSNWNETPGSGHPSLSASAKYETLKGLLVQSDNSSSEARYVTDDSPLGEAEYHARFYFDPNTVTMTLNDSHTIFDGLDGLNRRFVVEMRYANDGQNDVYQLRAGAWDDTTSAFSYGDWNAITDAWHEVELHWERSTGAGNDDGFMFFYLEGVEVDLIDTLDNDGQRITDVRLGLVEGVDTATAGDLYFDAFESRRDTFIGLFPLASLENQVVVVPQHSTLGNQQAFSDVPAMYGRPASSVVVQDDQAQVDDDASAAYVPPPRPLFVTILNDDFENNNFNAWTSATTDSGDLSTSAGSAHEGSYGMQALVDDTNAIYVYDDSLTTETRYRARFYFDPNSTTIANWDQMVIFQDEDGYMKVWLNYGNGDYYISIEVYNDSASGTESDWVTITDAWHAIEIDWKASSGPGNDDGHLTLYIDGTQAKQLSTVDNDTHSLGGVKLGLPNGTGSGTSGTLYFDAFESDDADYIGLLPAATPTPTNTPTVTPTPTNTATNTPIPPSIAGEWHFDEGSGSTAADSSGNNNDATLYNSTSWTTYGLSDDALLLDGTDDYARADAAAALKPADSLSLAAWIYPDAASEDDIIISYHNTGNEYGFRTDSDGFVEFHLNDLDPQLVSGPILPQDQWSHVIGVYDKTEGEIRLYVNGILVSSRNVTGSISYAAGDGLNFSDASKPFSGRLDEVYLYDEALTQAEIDDLYGLSPTPVPTATPTLEHTYTPTPTATSTPTPTQTATATATVDPNALTTGLVAYWHLDEVSGTRADEVSTNDLSDINTVEQDDGILGWAGDFSYTSKEYLRIDDNATVSVQGHQNKAWAFWVNVESLTGSSQGLLAKYGAGSNHEYRVSLNGGDQKVLFSVWDSTDTATSVTATTHGALSAGQWYFVYVYHDADNDEIGISINDGTVDTASFSAGVKDSDSPMLVGALRSDLWYFDGQIDELGIWNRTLTASEVSALYSTGDGLQHPFDGSPAPTPAPTPEPYISLNTDLAAYWDLDEASGTRDDAVASSDMSDHNSVLQGTGLVGNSADFETTNDEYLSTSDNAAVSVAGNADKAWAFWINVESFPGSSFGLLSKYGAGSSHEYRVSLNGGDEKVQFSVWDSNDVSTSVTANSHGALNTGEWYFVYVYHDEHEDEIGISINNGTIDKVTYSKGVRDLTLNLLLGALRADLWHFDGEIDEVGIWDRTLTADELTYLYNEGNGQAYPFTEPPIAPETPAPDWISHEYSYDANHPHAVSQVVRNKGGLGQYTDTYSYDANGNMTCRIEDGVTWRQTYNAENRLSKVEEITSGTCASGTAGDTWTFTYDGNGTRIKQVNPDDTISLFLGGGMYTVKDASGTTPVVTKYYSIAGQRIAMREGNDTRFLLTDHLGSVVAVTDDTGALVANSQQRYMAFGSELLEADSPTDFSYTGQRSNTGDFGLMDYNARWYSPSLGRFTQPDTIVPNLLNPQSLNRYSYTFNNPINFSDPSGHNPYACFSDPKCANSYYSNHSSDFQDHQVIELYHHSGQKDAIKNFVETNYGVSLVDGRLNGNNVEWDIDGARAAGRAVVDTGRKLGETAGTSGGDAFQAVYGDLTILWGNSFRDGDPNAKWMSDDCRNAGAYGCTSSASMISFTSLWTTSTNRPPSHAFDLSVHNVVHELGHAFGGSFASDGPYQALASGGQFRSIVNNDPRSGFHPPPSLSSSHMWRMDIGPYPTSNGNEVFADMFLGWVYGKWASNTTGANMASFMNDTLTIDGTTYGMSYWTSQ
ncbi:MAG: hypothetical protein D8M60_02595 [Chloroflexi bacterium]|nr:hypothetical protein [Chloroflexota bacterium]